MSSSLDQRKKARTTPMGFSLKDRTYGTRSSYASVVYFHYDKQNFGIPSNVNPDAFSSSVVTQVTRGVIEDDIQKIQISKSIEASSGTFNITLLPSKNWKQVLSPGDWIMIFFDDKYGAASRYLNDKASTKNMVMLASIDRVSKSLSKNEDTDRVELRYNISGRNFGKVFEETDIWYDPYQLQNDTINRVILPNAGLELTGNPSKMCKALLNVFLGKGEQFPKGRTSDLRNWRIPSSLAQMLGSNSTDPKFFDVLGIKIEDNLPGFKQRQMLTLNSNGSLHNLLKRCSNELVNELYYEEHRTKDGVKPTVFLKPRPINTPFLESHCGSDAAAKASLARLNGKSKTLQKHSDENYVEISPSEILYENLGKDDHSRFNLFWLRPINNLEDHFAYAANNNSTSGISNPTLNTYSIERYGLKRFDQILEFCHTTNEGGSATPEIELWKAFMIQLYDMHYANHLYDAGTIECTGVLEAELGKALIVKSEVPTSPDKVYFIEGYEHSWSFPGKWTTTFTVTHGQFKVASGLNIYIDAIGPGDFGRPDVTTNSVYTAKSVTSKEERT